jgi:hypothetical protein
LKNDSFAEYTATFMPYRFLKDIFFIKGRL